MDPHMTPPGLVCWSLALVGLHMWEGLWCVGKQKSMRIYHVEGHKPLLSPGDDEDEALSSVWWL